MTTSPGWMDHLTNPKSWVLKKFVFDLLQDRYPRSEKLLERIGHYLVTEEDIKQFSQLLIDVYEVAYTKAVADHKSALAKHNLKATITSPGPRTPE